MGLVVKCVECNDHDPVTLQTHDGHFTKGHLFISLLEHRTLSLGGSYCTEVSYSTSSTVCRDHGGKGFLALKYHPKTSLIFTL